MSIGGKQPRILLAARTTTSAAAAAANLQASRPLTCSQVNSAGGLPDVDSMNLIQRDGIRRRSKDSKATRSSGSSSSSKAVMTCSICLEDVEADRVHKLCEFCSCSISEFASTLGGLSYAAFVATDMFLQLYLQ